MRISMFFLVFAFSMQNIDKLKKVVEEGNYYGAQQMYKSISARYENCVDKKKNFVVCFLMPVSGLNRHVWKSNVVVVLYGILDENDDFSSSSWQATPFIINSGMRHWWRVHALLQICICSEVLWGFGSPSFGCLHPIGTWTGQYSCITDYTHETWYVICSWDFNLFSFLVKCGEFKGLGYDNFWV